MNHIEAIENIANQGSQGKVHFARVDPHFPKAVSDAILVVDQNAFNPSNDKATQTRLAAAIGRELATGKPAHEGHLDQTKAILVDMMIQEAAAAKLRSMGEKDPLQDLSNSPWRDDNEFNSPRQLLKRNGLDPSTIIDSANVPDLQSIASGRYENIKNPYTTFAISTQAGIDSVAMKTPTMRAAGMESEPIDRSRLVTGPQSTKAIAPVDFGRKSLGR